MSGTAWGGGREGTVTRKTVSSNILRNFICDVGQINFDSKLLPGLYGFGRKASSSATVVLRRHTWYLTEDLISLALFDDSLPEDTRNSLAQAIGQLPPVVIEIRKPTLPDLHSQSHVDYVWERSRLVFDLLKIDPDFLLSADWSDGVRYHLRAHQSAGF